jgi:cyanate lyase
MSKDEMNGLGKTTKVVDQGDLYGNPIVDENKPDITQGKDLDLDDIELSEEEEQMLKKKLDTIRKNDPFIYR